MKNWSDGIHLEVYITRYILGQHNFMLWLMEFIDNK